MPATPLIFFEVGGHKNNDGTDITKKQSQVHSDRRLKPLFRVLRGSTSGHIVLTPDRIFTDCLIFANFRREIF